MVPDPGNQPWNQRGSTVQGSVEPTSQVYVPSDPTFDTVDYSWQAPNREHGRLEHVTYGSPGHVTPTGKNYLVVYTPPGYDPRRAKPYPTLYLSHGGGGNEVDWSTQGALDEIMDNLIDTGEIQPTVVVMPNANGYPTSTDNEAYARDLIDNMVPYVESRYHVSASPDDRAFSGLSAGGIITKLAHALPPSGVQVLRDDERRPGARPGATHSSTGGSASGQVDLHRRGLAGPDPRRRFPNQSHRSDP
jgi:enterochelin esterase-like enzyme